MKTWSFATVACCGALLIVTVPPLAQAASNSLLLDAEPQYASKLCWAAADVLAVNHFYPSCPLAATATPPPYPTGQALEAAANELSLAGAGTLSHFLVDVCEPQIGNCNDFGFPLLNGLTFNTGFSSSTPPTVGNNSTGLTWDAAKGEIDAGRPFLFMWDYSANNVGSLPVGKHVLVAIGYSDEKDSSGTQYLQIWDPWPVPLTPPSVVTACGPTPATAVTPEHNRWVLFSTYTYPWNELGATVTPLHENDQWHLAVATPPVPQAPTLSVDGAAAQPPPPPAPQPPPRPSPPAFAYIKELHPAPPALKAVPFAEALAATVPQARRLHLQVPGVVAPTLGVPFPIVALGFTQLLNPSHDPTTLLSDRTSTVLFPVMSHGEVVDAFLMVLMDGGWQVKGYANLEITQRLVAFRARYAALKHYPLDSFYMVSVPGEVAFFAAHGHKTDAKLIPAATDPSIKAVAGKAAPAGKQLNDLILAIRHDLDRYPDRGRDSDRPSPQQ